VRDAADLMLTFYFVGFEKLCCMRGRNRQISLRSAAAERRFGDLVDERRTRPRRQMIRETSLTAHSADVETRQQRASRPLSSGEDLSDHVRVPTLKSAMQGDQNPASRLPSSRVAPAPSPLFSCPSSQRTAPCRRE
jgi:hypothetical protein